MVNNTIFFIYTSFNKASHISQGGKDYFIIYPDRLRRKSGYAAGAMPGVWDRHSEISLETLAEAKCGGFALSDPCLRSAATSFGSRGFARLSVSWEISGSLDFFVLFYQEKRTMKNYCYTYSGNIITRSDVSTYGYSQTNAGPHAVTAITDATGTLLPQHSQSVCYTPFNKLSHIGQRGYDYFITYGPDRLRRCVSHTSGSVPDIWDRPSEISIETLAEAKCGGLVLSDPCLRSAATSFGSRGFARLSVSWEISGSLDFFVLFYQEKRTMKNYCYTYSGNIITRSDFTSPKGGIGDYAYTEVDAGPHAVTGITDASGTLLPGQRQSISYTAFNKASHISQGTKDYFIIYPDRLRRRSVLFCANTDATVQTKYYLFGDYEKEITQNETKHLHYISGGDGLAAIWVKWDSGEDTLFYIMKDHLGSIVGAINSASGETHRQSFDAWGRKRNPTNWTYSNIPSFIFDRGFTGHEHMHLFGLINMNGRLYDVATCRFLSPDPYVQMPDYSQNFNRYSYALNNPLVYTDPSGEFLIPAIMLGAFINTSIQLLSGNVNSMGDFALALGVGALSGAAGAGAGSAISSVAGGGIGVGSGALTGATGGFAGGFVGGAGNAWANGANFSDGITAGLVGGGWGALGGAVVGGIAGGIRANKMGLDFWDGTGTSISESQVVVNNGGSLDGDSTGINNTSSLNDFKNANFKGSEYASAIYGDESKKLLEMTGYTLDKNSGSFINSKGEFISGFTVASKEGVFAQLNTMIGISPNSAIYSNNLKAVLGHELIHAYHYQTGFMTRYGEATSEYYCYRYSASVISSNQLNYSNSMNYIWKPQAVKIPFGFKTVYPSWIPRNIF